RIGPRDRIARPTTHVIQEALGAVNRLQPEVGHQLIVERPALLKAIHAHLDMGDSIDLHPPRPLPLYTRSRSYRRTAAPEPRAVRAATRCCFRTKREWPAN